MQMAELYHPLEKAVGRSFAPSTEPAVAQISSPKIGCHWSICAQGIWLTADLRCSTALAKFRALVAERRPKVALPRVFQRRTAAFELSPFVQYAAFLRLIRRDANFAAV